MNEPDRDNTTGNEATPSHGLHCTDREVLVQASRKLLERTPPADYAAEWARVLAAEKDDTAHDEISLLIFRLRSEWLALPTAVLRQVGEVRPTHRIPHRGGVLRGLVNIEGQLHLCVALETLLGLESADTDHQARQPRMIVMGQDVQTWVILADEIYQIVRCRRERIRPVPVTLAKSPTGHSSGIVELEGNQVCLLDTKRLFDALARSVR